jgi:Txe/YoeB family toxin of toxin-antitoxin system
MVNYKVVFYKQAIKDSRNLKENGLDKKAKQLIEILKKDPYQNPPPCEKLQGNLKDYYSRRINRQHRLLYFVREENKTVYVVRMWTHYE